MQLAPLIGLLDQCSVKLIHVTNFARTYFLYSSKRVLLESEASVSVDAEVINVAAAGVANGYAQRDTRAALSGNT